MLNIVGILSTAQVGVLGFLGR